MSSIALFPCSCIPVTGVISELSRAFELSLYTDDDLIADTALRCDWQSETLRKMMYGGTSVFNQFTLERERAINSFRTVLAEKLESSERYFFHGFLVSLISSRISHVLKVLIVDSKQARVDWAVKQGLTKREAKKKVRSHDVLAYEWTDFLFKKEAYVKALYDLVVPVGDKNDKALINEIIENYRKTSLLHTTESQQAVKDMKLEASVERVLLEKGHKIQVHANKGNISLLAGNTVFNFSRFSKELTYLVQGVKGVQSVHVDKNPDCVASIYRRQKFELPSKVLFVDDEKEFVKTVSERLISRDVGTYGVYNGEDALDLVADDPPDVMVLDLKMPGLHGVEVLRRVKATAPEVEVIILTGHGTSKDMLECMELGAFAYMNKPVDIEELSAMIKSANKTSPTKAASTLEIEKEVV